MAKHQGQEEFLIVGDACMKKVLLGIALILFGFNLTYIAVQAEWQGVDIFGLSVSIAGLALSLHSGLKKE